MTKRDALMHFELELKTLLATINNEELKSFYSNEMERFAALFGRFLQEEGPSVEWDKIQKLPEGAVKEYAELSAPKGEALVRLKTFVTKTLRKLIEKSNIFRYFRSVII